MSSVPEDCGPRPCPYEHAARPSADRPNTWQHRARVRLYTLWHELDAVCTGPGEGKCRDGVKLRELRNGAACLLTVAGRLIEEAGRSRWRSWLRLRRLRSWWHGELYEGSLSCLHQAEVFLTALLEPARARDRADSIVALARPFCRGDPRLVRVEAALQRSTGRKPDPQLPAALAALLRAAYAIEEERAVRNRNFRNRLIRAGLTLVALLGAVVAIAFSVPDAVRVCQPTSCLGGALAGGREVGMVMLLGMLGAALPVMGRLQEMGGSWNPYNLTLFQEFVKLPVGALTAVTGLLLVDTDWMPMLEPATNWNGVMAYAVILGITQLAFTRNIDRRAAKLLAAEPDKEESQQLENVPDGRR